MDVSLCFERMCEIPTASNLKMDVCPKPMTVPSARARHPISPLRCAQDDPLLSFRAKLNTCPGLRAIPECHPERSEGSVNRHELSRCSDRIHCRTATGPRIWIRPLQPKTAS